MHGKTLGPLEKEATHRKVSRIPAPPTVVPNQSGVEIAPKPTPERIAA
jgi:hypothetical protein